MKRYNPKEIEPKWQQIWQESHIYEANTDTSKPKRYILEYFPYPSGAAMHVGHVRNYTIGDVMSRHARMSGYNVLHPMGWDAFGLPAENYAIKTGISPQQAIAENTTKFKQQLTTMGFSYDWSREFASSEPEYYRWTQWFFLMLYKRGLAYRKESAQWWCPIDKTILANEQVENGHCWRCGSEVEKKTLKQWFFKITDYADRLSKDLDDVDWPESIKSMQRNWIGRSTGAEIEFSVAGSSTEKVTVFTTRADTLFGATFLVLAPEHPLLDIIVPEEHRQQVENYQQKARNKTDIERQETNREKTGAFTGAYAVNPASKEKIPIWTADYVLMGYGTGAIMAVPGHDQRDNEFAKKFNVPIRQVVAERFSHAGNEFRADAPLVPRQVVCMVVRHPYDEKFLISRPHGSEFWSPVMGGIDDGETPIQAAKRELLEESGYTDIASIEEKGDVIASEFYAQHKHANRIAYIQTIVVKLKSLNKKDEQAVDADEQELKWASQAEVDKLCIGAGAKEIYQIADGIERPMAFEGRLIHSGEFSGNLTSEARDAITAWLEKQKLGHEKVNYRMRDWLISRQRYWGAPIPMIHCPKDGIVAVPEEQLPVVLPELKSFEPSGDGRSPLANVPEFVNTTCPQCDGPAERETDTMDGFACSSWYFLRFADPRNDKRPFDADKIKAWLPVDDYIGGAEHAVMHLLYARMWTKVMQDEGLVDFSEPFKKLRNQGMILAPDGQKMSKSKGNTIQPDELIGQGYGADSVRIMELFIGPWNQSVNWSVEGMGGSYRFLQRIWTLVDELLSSSPAAHQQENSELKKIIHRTVKKVGQDVTEMSFNTAIASMMEAVNNLYRQKTTTAYTEYYDEWKTSLTTIVQLIAPFAPHIAEELWYALGNETSVHTSEWPQYDEQYLVEDAVTIAVQVNGKLRSTLSVPVGSDEAVVVQTAHRDAKVTSYLEGKQIRKVVYVSGRLLNFVVT